MRIALIISICFLSLFSNAQNTAVYAGLFPEMGLNIPLTERFKYTAKIESQHVLFTDDATNQNELSYFHNQTDLQSFVEFKVTSRIKMAVGYQYRLEDGENSHRSIQQLTWLNQFRIFRLGSRLRADQKFSPSISPEYRLRYRASSDIPLQGEKLDDGEKYFLLSNEVIFALQGGESSIENRIVVGIGHFFSRTEKLELSIDYRTDPYFSNVNRHRIWCKISFYWNLKGFK
jgi:hypothetical protein